MLNKRQLQKLESATDWHDFQSQFGFKFAKGRTPEEWVLVAEQLAENNDDKLPISTWLYKNGYQGLSQAMRKRPELFKNIEQEKTSFRTPEEWVLVAVQLAKDNDSKLPIGKWLIDNGYGGLDRVMRKQPELFKRIKREKKYNSSKEWVLVAEQLAEDNGDVLPSCTWLLNNNYTGLDRAIRKYPKLFKHIKQDKNWHTAKEWVPIAEQLAKDNGDVLPNFTWMKKNGYNSLYQILKKHPEMFKHIEQKDA